MGPARSRAIPTTGLRRRSRRERRSRGRPPARAGRKAREKERGGTPHRGERGETPRRLVAAHRRRSSSGTSTVEKRRGKIKRTNRKEEKPWRPNRRRLNPRHGGQILDLVLNLPPYSLDLPPSCSIRLFPSRGRGDLGERAAEEEV